MVVALASAVRAVEKAGSRHREADARLFRQEAGDRGCVAGVLLMPEGDDADAGGLRHAAEVGDRNARNAVDRVDAVKLERIDDEVEAIGQRPVRRRRIRAFAFLLNHRAGHAILQVTQYPQGPFGSSLFHNSPCPKRPTRHAPRVRSIPFPQNLLGSPGTLVL